MRLVWFRRDLRSFDNTALTAALNSGDPVAAMYIATPEQWHQHHLAPIQADLIWRRLVELQQELAALNVPLFISKSRIFKRRLWRLASWRKHLMPHKFSPIVITNWTSSNVINRHSSY